jgi:hypothetical protein
LHTTAPQGAVVVSGTSARRLTAGVVHRVIQLPALHEIQPPRLSSACPRWRRARSQAAASELIVISAPRPAARRGRADAFGAGLREPQRQRDNDCSAGTSQRHAARPWQGVCW